MFWLFFLSKMGFSFREDHSQVKINTAKEIVSALAVILVLSVLTAGCGGKKLPALSGTA